MGCHLVNMLQETSVHNMYRWFVSVLSLVCVTLGDTLSTGPQPQACEKLSPQSNSSEEPSPSNRQVSELGSRLFPGDPWGDYSLDKDPEKVKPKGLWDNKCYFKPLSSGGNLLCSNS